MRREIFFSQKVFRGWVWNKIITARADTRGEFASFKSKLHREGVQV